MAKTPWFDINHTMGLPGTEKEEYWTPPLRPAPEPDKPKEKGPPEFKITGCKIVVPADGLKENKPFDVQGTVELLTSSPASPQILLDAIAKYGDKPDDCIASLIEAQVDTAAQTFQATCKTLYYHQDFLRDSEKPADATFTLTIKASGAAAEKDFFSDPVTLPMATEHITLKKERYDDTWSDKKGNAEKYPKSGENYVPGNKVQKLQENLTQFAFLDKNSSTGYFGDKTEAAVKKFQEYAKKPERKKAKEGKIFWLKDDKIAFKGEADGIVGPKTEDEIAVWFQNDYVKPDPEYRKNDFDEEGYQNDKGKREDQNYHERYQIQDFQKLLADVGAYVGKIDGWFGEKTEAAVKLFQQAAAKGEFVDKSGKKVVLEEKDKLKGHREGVGCGKTADSLKERKDAGHKVEKELAIDLDFIARMEGTKNKIYVPVDDDGKVIEKSGPTIASGFDLGQIDLTGLKKYGFASDLETKLAPYVGLKGTTSDDFVKTHPLAISNSEVSEINNKVMPAHGKKAEAFYNEAVTSEGKKFVTLPSAIQTAFASVCFQYGSAPKFRNTIISGNYKEAVKELLHFTSQTTKVKNPVTHETKNLMLFIERRCQEARRMEKGIDDESIKNQALQAIKERETEWETAYGRKKWWKD